MRSTFLYISFLGTVSLLSFILIQSDFRQNKSLVSECLSVSIIQQCNDNGTTNQADDMIELVVTAEGAGTGYTVSTTGGVTADDWHFRIDSNNHASRFQWCW